jgi:hypothetical protein
VSDLPAKADPRGAHRPSSRISSCSWSISTIKRVRALKAQQQSTLIVCKGAEEIARTVGETNPGNIEALLKGAL